ncbi:MAG: TonB-dependent receptor [Acidobacteria bacterium]|nr:TonB-dependent receptor [Acidobacteriota bacterium]
MTSALFALDQQWTPKLAYRVAYHLVDTRRAVPNGPGGTGFQPRFWETSYFNGRIDTAQGRVSYSTSRQIVTAGGEWEREAFDNGGTSRAATGDTSYRARTTQRSASIFAEDQIRLLGSKLQITLSGRFQNFDLRRPVLTGSIPGYLSTPVPSPPNAWTGDASASYRVAANTKLRGHAGNSYRAPSLYERYGTGFFGGAFTPYGDPRLSSERSIGGDFGIDQYFGSRRARLSATYFYTELRSVIGFDFSGIVNRVSDPFGRSSGYFSTNGGLARGVEIEGESALWTGMLLRASYTHTRTLERRAIAAGTRVTPRILPNMTTITATQTLRRASFTATFLGAGEYTGVIFGRAIIWEGPRRLDTSASVRIANSEKLRPELFVRVENVLNQRYYEDGFRTPNRWATAGLRIGWR